MPRKIKQNKEAKKDRIAEILANEKLITEALQRAVREADEMHKRAGKPLVTWKDGKAIWVKTDANRK